MSTGSFKNDQIVTKENLDPTLKSVIIVVQASSSSVENFSSIYLRKDDNEAVISCENNCNDSAVVTNVCKLFFETLTNKNSFYIFGKPSLRTAFVVISIVYFIPSSILKS